MQVSLNWVVPFASRHQMNKVGTVAKSRLATNVYKRSRGSGEAAHRRTNLVLVSFGSHECSRHRGVRRKHVRQAQVCLGRRQRARTPSFPAPAAARLRLLRWLLCLGGLNVVNRQFDGVQRISRYAIPEPNVRLISFKNHQNREKDLTWLPP